MGFEETGGALERNCSLVREVTRWCQCQRAPSGSRHNEPIRLYFYFRHAAYRAIPSLRHGYRSRSPWHTHNPDPLSARLQSTCIENKFPCTLASTRLICSMVSIASRLHPDADAASAPDSLEPLIADVTCLFTRVKLSAVDRSELTIIVKIC